MAGMWGGSVPLESLPDAIVILETPSSPLDARLKALRFIQTYVETERLSSLVDRMKINQLVLDSIMSLLNREDLIPDLRKRQLVRTECFIMLAKILESKSLFAGAKPMDDAHVKYGEDLTTSTGYPAPIVHESKDDVSVRSKSLIIGREEDKSDTSTTNDGNDEGSVLSRSVSVKSLHSMSSDISKSSVATSKRSLLSRTAPLKPSVNATATHQSVLAAVVSRADRRAVSGHMKPRQSVISGPSLRPERLVPGVDPYDIIQVDKRLGYQKPRMWLPFAGPEMSSTLVPKPRPRGRMQMQSEQIAQDYLKMQAMLSYVADMVVPAKPKKSGKQQVGSAGRKKDDVLMDKSLYSEAVREAILMWSPLLGLNVPVWAKRGTDAQDLLLAAARGAGSVSALTDSRPPPAGPPPKAPPPPGPPPGISAQQSAVLKTVLADQRKQPAEEDIAAKGAKSIILSKQTLQKLLREQQHLSVQNRENLRRTLDVLSTGDGYTDSVSSADIERVQREIQQNLQSQKDTQLQTMSTMASIMSDTIKVQYAALPPRYLLVVDRAGARSRGVFERAMDTFSRIRRHNYLALAVGIWKIILIQQKTLARRPMYAKIASVHLMSGWLQDRKVQRIRMWFTAWKDNVSKGIFLEREKAALPIQCLYRWWRDRKKFIKLHLAGPYNGPLSDIYMGPHRIVLYFIPRVIRSSRRMYWQAAILIQTQWRRYFIQKDYLVQLRRVLLLQSVVRMYPKWVQYRRLKATTIKCQAWARRTVRRICYKRLKYCTVIVQKYVRRYMAILLKLNILDFIWEVREEPLGAIIRIQCRWRIKIARRKAAAKRLHLKRRQWAALVMQRNWYRRNGSYHTFVLMCAYRAADVEEDKLEQLGEDMCRFYSARKIQRMYLVHYGQRNITSVVKLQCWYRGTRGFRVVAALRLEKWAARKLHHWARVWMRYKHRCQRVIARAWWFNKTGRYVRHLHAHARWLDEQEDRAKWQLQYAAATRIQALCYGFTARRFVIRHRAAYVIQKPMKFFIARLMWKKKIRDMSNVFVRKVVGNIVGRGLMNATRLTVAQHNVVIRKIQRLARGYIVRNTLAYARTVARKMGIAAIKLQRFWRRSGAFVKAVQEVLALKRMDINPYRTCPTAHDILQALRLDTSKYFNSSDPRAGLLTAGFLRRLGLSELLPIFPASKYKYATDLRSLTVDKMVFLYDKWAKKDSKSDTNSRGVRGSRKAPRAAFQEIRSCLWPTVPPTTEKSRNAISGLFAVQEVMAPAEFNDFVTVNFTKRFGSSFSARAENLARSLCSTAYSGYNNFKSIGFVLTKSQVTRALSVPKVPAEVKNMIEKMSSPPDGELSKEAIAERSWDVSRVKSCAECLQMAVEMLLILLPEGALRNIVSAASVIVATYRRRFTYTVAKAKEGETKRKEEAALKAAAAAKQKKKGGNARASAASSPVSTPSKSRSASVSSTEDPAAGEFESSNDVGVTSSKVMTVQESVDKPFTGSLEDIDLEMNMSICKLYLEVLEKLTRGSSGVQSLKNVWHNKSLIVKFRKEKAFRILQASTIEYLQMRKMNHVHKTWTRLRHIEAIEYRLAEIAETRRQRLEMIGYQLDWIPRYGWREEMDDYGYSYWVDDVRYADSTYEMPKYTVDDWNAATRIQWTTQRWLEVVYEKKRLRELARQEALANHEKMMQEEFGRTQRAVTVSLGIMKRLVSSITAVNITEKKQDCSPASFLPFKLKFVEVDVFKAHEWVIVRFDEDPPHYKVAIVLKFSKTKFKYDVRLVSGTIVKGVLPSRICKMNYDIGTMVEARYKGAALFYRGTITAIQTSLTSSAYEYSIKYSDGEREVRVPGTMIRPDPREVVSFFKERNRLLKFFEKREQRAIHIENIRKERLLRVAMAAKVCEDKFKEHWTNAVRLPGCRNAIPGESLMGMIESAKPLSPMQYQGFCRVYYTKAALKFGWREIKKVGSDGETRITYLNNYTMEEVSVPPIYLPVEHFHAKKLQGIWAVHQARKQMQQLLLKDSMGTLVASSILRYQQIAYIGYGLEGVSASQMLHRAGFPDIADVVEQYLSTRPSVAKDTSVETLLELPKDKFGSIGISRHGDVKDLERFQEWWTSTSPDKRQLSLSFLNYYSDPEDERSIVECIQASEPIVRPRLTRAYRNSVSRIQAISNKMLQSKYPITKMQLEAFLETYAGKPGLAQENIYMIVDKHTTNTYEEEREAYMILKGSTRRIIAILKHFKINSIRKYILSVERKADAIIAACDHEPREKTTGGEAKACWLLRRDVLEYILSVEDATIVLQKCLRGLTKRLWYLRTKALRLRSAIMIQCLVRARRAWKIAARFQAELKAEWEQLWNDKDRVLYYYNNSTGQSTYEEPVEVYRPLVRDFRSDALIQAWPSLDDSVQGLAPQASRSSVESTTEKVAIAAVPAVGAATAMYMRDNTVCSCCEERKTMRICIDCPPPSVGRAASPRRRMPTPFCFPCYAAVHSNDPSRINHRFQDLDDQTVQYMTCCECAEPATRKCLGILDDKEIDDLCTKLQRANSLNWMRVLKNANVGGERRVAMMMDQLSGSAGTAGTDKQVFLTASQLQQVRMMLERTRAECDECYCDRCYKDLHSAGKRAMHRWVGFAPQAPVCGVCDRSPAELECRDCGGGRFCKSCFKVFHSKGRKRKHQSAVLKEEIPDGYLECFVCDRRAATESCPDCSTPCCNSCLECVHVRKCAKRLAALNATANLKLCVACGEEADQKCEQCGDLYCSRTWMGNPGCFLSYHSKGNRVAHNTVPITKVGSPEDVEEGDDEGDELAPQVVKTKSKNTADCGGKKSMRKSAKGKSTSRSPTRNRPGAAVKV